MLIFAIDGCPSRESPANTRWSWLGVGTTKLESNQATKYLQACVPERPFNDIISGEDRVTIIKLLLKRPTYTLGAISIVIEENSMHHCFVACSGDRLYEFSHSSLLRKFTLWQHQTIQDTVTENTTFCLRSVEFFGDANPAVIAVSLKSSLCFEGDGVSPVHSWWPVECPGMLGCTMLGTASDLEHGTKVLITRP